MQSDFSDSLPNCLRKKLTSVPSFVPVSSPVWGSNLNVKEIQAVLINYTPNLKQTFIEKSTELPRQTMPRTWNNSSKLTKYNSKLDALHDKHFLISYIQRRQKIRRGERERRLDQTWGSDKRKFKTWGAKKIKSVSL